MTTIQRNGYVIAGSQAAAKARVKRYYTHIKKRKVVNVGRVMNIKGSYIITSGTMKVWYYSIAWKSPQTWKKKRTKKRK